MSKFEDYVAPRIPEIREWAAQGLTNLEIAKKLAIAEKTLYTYMQDYPILRLTLIEGRQLAVGEIRAAMFKRATGFTYTETKKVTKKQGEEEIVTEEINEKYSVPSETAAAMLLRIWDKDYRDRDAKSVELKERETELKERIADSNYFFDENVPI